VKAKAGAVDGGWTEEIKSSSQITAMFGTSVFRVGCGQQTKNGLDSSKGKFRKALAKARQIG